MPVSISTTYCSQLVMVDPNQFLAAKWNFANFQSDNYSAVLMDYTTPASYAETVVVVGGIAVDGQVISAGCNHKATHTATVEDTESQWAQPTAVKYEWEGKTKEGKPVQASIDTTIDLVDRVDVLAHVPGFIKTIAGQAAGTRPYIYQVRYCSYTLSCFR
jgi:Svf1-like C-terminal lipocalin-like domain